ncbi:hypothetical protein HK100_010223, partial [Physocladia obscura]
MPQANSPASFQNDENIIGANEFEGEHEETLERTRKNTTSNASLPTTPSNYSLQHRENSKKSQKKVHWNPKDSVNYGPESPPPSLVSSEETSSSSFEYHCGIPDSLGASIITWISASSSSSSAAFGRLRFEQVHHTLSSKQAARLKSTVTTTLKSVDTVHKSTLSLSEAAVKLSYKVSAGLDVGILRATLANAGFRETGPTVSDWNIFWSNGKIESHEFRSLN